MSKLRVHVAALSSQDPTFWVTKERVAAACKRHKALARHVAFDWSWDHDRFAEGIAQADAMIGWRFPRSELRDMATVAGLRDRLQEAMTAAVPGARVMGAGVPRLANTLAIAHPATRAETLVMAFDLEGIALSAGSACSSGKVGPSHVLEAMGEGALARNTIRISLGETTTADAVARCAEVWQALDRRLGGERSAA